METKKTAGKPAVKAPRTDYKAGARVKVIRRTGEEVAGRFDSVITTPTGPFLRIKIAGAEKPYDARPAKVRGY